VDINEVKSFLDQYQIKPSKSKGQNFLINQDDLDSIIKSAGLKKNDNVLEIGPGLGVLTEQLAKKSKKVISVEVDKKVVYFLKQKFKGTKNLHILEKDILKIKNEEIFKLFSNQKYKVVANLPYNITKPVIRKFLEYPPQPDQITFLIQKEVAEKIVSKPNKNSFLGLTVQYYGEPSIDGYVSATSFYPQPKVVSAILKIKLYNDRISPEIKNIYPDLSKFNKKLFWQIVKFGYSSPRKQLHNNLAAGLDLTSKELKSLFKKIGWREDIRAEKLNLSDWAKFLKLYVVNK